MQKCDTDNSSWSRADKGIASAAEIYLAVNDVNRDPRYK